MADRKDRRDLSRLPNPGVHDGRNPQEHRAGKRSLLVAGERFQRGIGMVAPQQAVYDLRGQFQRFRSLAGVDAMDMYSRSDLVFEVWADGRKLWESCVLRAATTRASWTSISPERRP